MVTRRDVLTAIGSASVATLAGCRTRDRGGTDCLGSSGNTDVPTIRAPTSAVGDPLLVSLDGFEPEVDVTLALSATDVRDVDYRLETTATTDASGSFAGRACPPGLGRMALGDARPSSDPDPPSFVVGDRSEQRLAVTARVDGDRRAETTTTRRYRDLSVRTRRVEGSDGGESGVDETRAATSGVRGTAVDESSVDAPGVVGRLFLPSGSDAVPGVVTIHGSGGHRPDRLSHLLATQGYATLALQYFGVEGLPERLADVPLGYFQDGIEWLLSRDRVATDGVGLVGLSRGVEAALFAAADFDGPTAVVGFSGSGLVAPTPGALDGPAPWTRDGRPVVPASKLRSYRRVFVDPRAACGDAACRYETPTDACATARCILRTLRDADPDAVAAASPPVDRIDGPVVLLSGRDDALWPGPVLSEVGLRLLAEADREGAQAHHSSVGAGHVFHLPYQSYEGLTGGRYGGDRSATARAAVAAWPRVLDCLSRGLGSSDRFARSLG